MDEKLEDIALEIVASVGEARSDYIAAIDAAHEGDFEEARNLIQEGEKAYRNGHRSHAVLLELTDRGELTYMNVLLTHAEDQLMSAETFGILAERFVSLYEKLYNK